MTTSARSTTRRVLWIAAAWFAATLVAGAVGVFDSGAGPPVAVGAAVGLPVVLVVALLAWSPAFRAWARSLDLRLLTMLQSWRIIGFAFLAVWAVDRLPAAFALPAALGDILVGLAAPAVALALVRPGGRSLFYAWTAIGIGDLLVAITLGILVNDGANMSAMAALPLSLIPTFVVPFALALHAISLLIAGTRGVADRASKPHASAEVPPSH